MANFEKKEEIEELNYFLVEKENNYPLVIYPVEDEDNIKILMPNSNDLIKIQNDIFEAIGLGNYPINLSLSSKAIDVQNIMNGKTEPNSKDFLGKKRNLEKDEKENIDNIILKEENNEIKENIKDKDNDDNKTKGRRKKEDSYENYADHNKFSEDNIIRKIKTFIFKYILELLNKSLEHTNLRFYPLNKDLNENLKRDFNEELLNRTIYDIYLNSEVNKRFPNSLYSNKYLIKKIFKEKSEKKTMKILSMKYIDILKHIRENDLKYFLQKIKEKERKNKGNFIDLYMKAVNYMLNQYENWFISKRGRNTTKKIKNDNKL